MELHSISNHNGVPQSKIHSKRCHKIFASANLLLSLSISYQHNETSSDSVGTLFELISINNILKSLKNYNISGKTKPSTAASQNKQPRTITKQ